jgi:AcrR family transcriptional regulator
LAGTRRRLNREVVVAAAVHLANEAGRSEAVTLTAVAASLGVRVPSLYNHVTSLDDLLHAITVHGTRRLIADLRAAVMGMVGREALLAMAVAYRRFARDQPGVYPLTIRAPDPGDEELTSLAQELLQILLLVLASMGWSGEDALHIVRGFRALLHGFASLEATGGFKMPLDLDDSFHRMLNSYLDGLSLERDPAGAS